MTYRISYQDGWAVAADAHDGEASRTECFATEYEALGRARELVEAASIMRSR